MEKNKFYSSGKFASMAHVTLRTIRYYDQKDILKPTYVDEHGVRFYTDADFAKLQQILLFKFLGFSLDDIREMTIDDSDTHHLINALNIQLKLVKDRIEQMQLVESSISDTINMLENNDRVNWTQTLDLIHLTSMEKSLKNQYQNASNISARINLHKLYSQNSKGWFPWIFEQCNIHSNMKILELGCGDGTLWKDNMDVIPDDIDITLSDISDGMLRDLKRTLGESNTSTHFNFKLIDCQDIPFPDNSFDLIIANHLLFYCSDIEKACLEIHRVLKNGGTFICGTYGSDHMKEISELVRNYDERISLSGEVLFDIFGLQNGADILKVFFDDVEIRKYEDSLIVTEPQHLIDYILSCHGNQNHYLLERYHDFCSYVQKLTNQGVHITKEAGIFVCSKKSKKSS